MIHHLSQKKLIGFYTGEQKYREEYIEFNYTLYLWLCTRVCYGLKLEKYPFQKSYNFIDKFNSLEIESANQASSQIHWSHKFQFFYKFDQLNTFRISSFQELLQGKFEK